MPDPIVEYAPFIMYAAIGLFGIALSAVSYFYLTSLNKMRDESKARKPKAKIIQFPIWRKSRK